MNRITVLDLFLMRMADAASLMLNSRDRDAVCGDLEESGATGSQALREVLSLVVRRRIEYLRGWRPWLTLVSLTVPMSVLVSLQSRRIADGAAIYHWLYFSNWDRTIIYNPGFWQELAECAPGVLLSYLALGCWSWTTGLLVGHFTRRMLWFSGPVFFVIVFLVGIFGVLNSLTIFWSCSVLATFAIMQRCFWGFSTGRCFLNVYSSYLWFCPHGEGCFMAIKWIGFPAPCR